MTLGPWPNFLPAGTEVAVNLLLIGLITATTTIWDLEAKNRRFHRPAILRTLIFWKLVLFQGALVFLVLWALVNTKRAIWNPPADAVWVSIAGLSLLKSIPVPKAGEAQRLFAVANWLFETMYDGLRLHIIRQSEDFKKYLQSRYNNKIDEFRDHVKVFIEHKYKETAAIQTKYVEDELDKLDKSDPKQKQQISWLVNYFGPLSTKQEWTSLFG